MTEAQAANPVPPVGVLLKEAHVTSRSLCSVVSCSRLVIGCALHEAAFHIVVVGAAYAAPTAVGVTGHISMVAPNYAKTRSALAKKIGLGRKRSPPINAGRKAGRKTATGR